MGYLFSRWVLINFQEKLILIKIKSIVHKNSTSIFSFHYVSFLNILRPYQNIAWVKWLPILKYVLKTKNFWRFYHIYYEKSTTIPVFQILPELPFDLFKRFPNFSKVRELVLFESWGNKYLTLYFHIPIDLLVKRDFYIVNKQITADCTDLILRFTRLNKWTV